MESVYTPHDSPLEKSETVVGDTLDGDPGASGRVRTFEYESITTPSGQRILPFGDDLGLTFSRKPRVTVTSAGLSFRSLFPERVRRVVDGI